MPKTKPDKTEILRFELQDTERQQLDKIATSIAFRNYMNPLVEIAKDNTLFYLVLAPALLALAGLIGLSWSYLGRDDLKTAKDILDDFQTTYSIARENGLVPAIGTTLAATFGGGLLQDFAQDRPEDFAQQLDDIDLFGIATDPGTYIDPIIGLGQNALDNAPAGSPLGTLDFIIRLFDDTPNNLW